VPIGTYVAYSSGFASWTATGAPGNVALVNGSFTHSGFQFPASSGTQWLDLTGAASNTATGVQQVAVTIPGVTYQLTFQVGNVFNPGGLFGTSSTVNVLVDGSLLMSAVNSLGAGTTTLTWESFSATFTASSVATTIAFVNGDPADDNSNGLDGVSLVATTLPSPWTNLRTGLAGASGVPVLTGSGTLVAGSTGALSLTLAKHNSPALLFVSLASSPVPFKGGTLVAVPPVVILGLATDGAGALTLPFQWPAGVPSATSLYFHCAIQDAAGPQGVALSNALKAVVP
jgi:hypothetical protein